jgi:hypothetical protein
MAAAKPPAQRSFTPSAQPQLAMEHQQLVDGNDTSLFGPATPGGSSSQLSEMFYLQLNERERADRVERAERAERAERERVERQAERERTERERADRMERETRFSVLVVACAAASVACAVVVAASGRRAA